MSVFTLVDSPTQWTAKQEDSDVGCVRVSPDDKTVAVGCFNGNVYIRSAPDSRLMYRIQAVKTSSPITAMRWHPKIASTIVCAAASGFVSAWHTETGQNLWTIEEKSNSVNSLDIAPSGLHFTTSGSDCTLRYYSLSTRQLVSELGSKAFLQGRVSGHELRVFASVFMDDNSIVSSGWDDTVLMWDLRSGQVARWMFGTHVCGEAVCFSKDNTMLITGSWRDHDQLQFWDVATSKLIESVTIGDKHENEYLQVYSLATSKNREYVAAAGSGLNCVAFYRVDDFSSVAMTQSYDCCVSSVHFGDRRFAYGLTDSTVVVNTYNP